MGIDNGEFKSYALIMNPVVTAYGFREHEIDEDGHEYNLQ